MPIAHEIYMRLIDENTFESPTYFEDRASLAGSRVTDALRLSALHSDAGKWH
jgi:hypothetical protein